LNLVKLIRNPRLGTLQVRACFTSIFVLAHELLLRARCAQGLTESDWLSKPHNSIQPLDVLELHDPFLKLYVAGSVLPPSFSCVLYELLWVWSRSLIANLWFPSLFLPVTCPFPDFAPWGSWL